MMLNRQQRLQAALMERFEPISLTIHDDSASHAGHAGAATGGETHYTVQMTAAEFAGQSRVARSRAVHSAVEREFQAGLHALALTLRAPGER